MVFFCIWTVLIVIINLFVEELLIRVSFLRQNKSLREEELVQKTFSTLTVKVADPWLVKMAAIKPPDVISQTNYAGCYPTSKETLWSECSLSLLVFTFRTRHTIFFLLMLHALFPVSSIDCVAVTQHHIQAWNDYFSILSHYWYLCGLKHNKNRAIFK